jgi:hypothetical protein
MAKLRGRVPKLRIIFREIVSLVETWVYWHCISGYSSNILAPFIVWLGGCPVGQPSLVRLCEHNSYLTKMVKFSQSPPQTPSVVECTKCLHRTVYKIRHIRCEIHLDTVTNTRNILKIKSTAIWQPYISSLWLQFTVSSYIESSCCQVQSHRMHTVRHVGTYTCFTHNME